MRAKVLKRSEAPPRDMGLFDEICDVVVAGGGPSGFATALAAARSGSKVLLVERYGYLGGMASTGLPFLKYGDGSKQRIFGIAGEFASRAISSGYATGNLARGWLPVDPEGVKFLFQEMVIESGVHLLLHSTVQGVSLKDGSISSVSIFGKGGSRSIRGKTFVDCTGDGDLAAYSAVPFTVGREDGKTMGMSLLFSLGNVNVEEFRSALSGGWPGLVRSRGIVIPPEIKEATFLDEDRFMPYITFSNRPGEVTFNWVQQVLDRKPLDPEDLTAAEIEARRRIHLLFEKVIRPHIPGCSESFLARTASQMGVRESRRIVGLYTLTEDDCRSRRDFPDTVALCTYGFDLHASSRTDAENVIIDSGFRGLIKIPYRVMVPSQGPKNLLVAGRSVSADRMALSAIRVMVPCMSMGEAAGRAAHLASKEGIDVADVPIDRLRAMLDLRY